MPARRAIRKVVRRIMIALLCLCIVVLWVWGRDGSTFHHGDDGGAEVSHKLRDDTSFLVEGEVEEEMRGFRTEEASRSDAGLNVPECPPLLLLTNLSLSSWNPS